jgi:NAD(P)-dependent dehydrogenase (short-subunit alcohol dehydrogenase family)
MFDLSGRVAVITGGNGGIGLGIAHALGEAGATLAIWGTNEEKNAKAAAELEAAGRTVRAYRCDVSDEEQVVATHRAVVDELGKAVNLDGAFLCFREATAHMIERGDGGSLIAISSTSAIHGAPRQEHYAASKAALLALTRGLAVELARYGIRANAILPGWTDTDMLAAGKSYEKFVSNTVSRTPVRRWGVPADMGPAAVFLADPTNAFHTGDTIVVDGGYTIF